MRALHSSWVSALGQICSSNRRPTFFAARCLTAHVDGGRLVFADADGHEASDDVFRRRVAHALGDFSENAVADGPAIEQPMIDRDVTSQPCSLCSA